MGTPPVVVRFAMSDPCDAFPAIGPAISPACGVVLCSIPTYKRHLVYCPAASTTVLRPLMLSSCGNYLSILCCYYVDGRFHV